MDEIELLFKKQNIINNNQISILKEYKIGKRLIKKFLDKINIKLTFFVFYIDIERFYKEYQKMSDFNSTEDQFVYKQTTHISNNNYYCKDKVFYE